MKKLVSLVVVLMLCLTSVAAMAASVPSKTTEDLTVVKVVPEFPDVPGADSILMTINQDKTSEAYATCAAEIEKLAAAESVVAYFDGAVTQDGEPADLEAMLDTEALSVYEMGAIALEGYETAMGKLTVTMTWPTVYEADEKVAVMIGIAGEDGAIAWTALEGVNVENEGIVTTMNPDTATAIQDGIALVAIVSK